MIIKSYIQVKPQRWTFDELTEVISEISGKRVTHRKGSFNDMKDYFRSVGLPAPVAELIAGIYQAVAEGETEKNSYDLTNIIVQQTPLK
ncbi:hypothetical protein PGC35_06930 [Psychrobacillus sp. PGGUH221]|uniref:hypothetical protein n=1 Tax=Psychrobacillus sp. PGGUH221 TaxID=3020058 RepID=UPI0035C6D17D